MIFFLKTAAKIFKNHIKERWMGYCFFIPILLISVFEFSHVILPPKLPANIYFLLATFEIGLSLLLLSEFSKEFRAMIISLYKTIRKHWLLQSEYELEIKDSDTIVNIRKKVNHYVNQEAAKQEKAFEQWKLELKFKQPNTRGRPILVFAFGIATISIVGVIFQSYSISMGEILKLPGYATSIAIFISAPVAYLIWMFRDQNNLWQIDNSRKDVNIKDFQRLSELACGAHFPEFKDGDESYSQRKQAAHSQQIAAIFQLQTFMEGAYGVEFMRPTFLLLKSIWGGLVEKDQLAWQEWLGELPRIEQLDSLNKLDALKWREKGEYARDSYAKFFSKPLGFTLHEVLVGDFGHRIRLNVVSVQGGLFAGMNQNMPGMTNLKLAKQELVGVRWNGADLSGAEFQGADLRVAELNGAILLRTKLQGVNLSSASMSGANFHEAVISGANMKNTQCQRARFRFAKLQNVDFRGAQLQGSDLIRANLQFADLRMACLQNADLRRASLIDTDLRGVRLNGNTLLDRCKINSNTRFGLLATEELFSDELEDIWINSDEIRQEWLNRGAIMV
jgi:uncharacterized protein YjbI with pentapeptide repeats